VMQRFERFLNDNPGRPIYINEVCAAVGVSARTLSLRCSERLGMSPHRYLFLRRMHQVRRVLVRSDPTTTTVTDVATDHGFWELGRFSVAYRGLFGESPSTTLRRQ
jgi:AraC-like DNA-binding protein